MGRPKGSVNKRTQAFLRTNGGDLPLDYMLRIMRDPKQPTERRDDMAKSAAPFLHAKLQAVQHSGEITTSKVIRTPAPSTNLDTWQKQYADKPETLQ